MKLYSTNEMLLIEIERMYYISYFKRLVAVGDIAADGLIKKSITADGVAIRYCYNANRDEVAIRELKVRKSTGRRKITLPYGFDVLDCKITGNGCKDIHCLDLTDIKRYSANVDLSCFTNLREVMFSSLPVNHILYTRKGMMLFGIEIDGWAFEGNVDGTVSLVKNN